MAQYVDAILLASDPQPNFFATTNGRRAAKAAAG